MIRSSLIGIAFFALFADGLLATGTDQIALAPLKRGVRDGEAAISLENALRFQLSEFGPVASSLETRDALRGLRLRDIDSAPPEIIAELAKALGADWVVVATVHDVRRMEISDLALSVRIYEGESGVLAWAGFKGRNGLDSRKMLGIGVVTSIDDLSRELVRRLLEESLLASDNRAGAGNRPPKTIGRLALVPFTGYVERDALGVADAVTEASRAVLLRQGIELVQPGCVAEALRLQRAQVWGEMTEATRDYLHQTCGADRLLTGSVGQWETNGPASEPVPAISLAVRLLEATTGKIVWMSSIEKTGRSSESLFRAGRVYSRGQLLVRLLTKLTDAMMTDSRIPSS